MKITFAPFLAALPKSAILEISDLCEFLTPAKIGEISALQLQYVDALFQSAEIFHPGCRKVVISDTHTEFTRDFSYEIWRTNVDSTIIMYARIAAYVNFLKTLKNPIHVIFPDTDLLINANLRELFKRDFDIAMPFRYQRPNMPIICSLLIVHGKKIERAISFFEQLLAIYARKYPQYLTWWGDQCALADIIGLRKQLDLNIIKKLKSEQMALMERGGWNLLLLENEIWNFCPPKELKKDALFPEKKILHFLGYLRKKKMLAYFNDHIKSRR